jgi:hypothetical protein
MERILVDGCVSCWNTSGFRCLYRIIKLFFQLSVLAKKFHMFGDASLWSILGGVILGAILFMASDLIRSFLT